MVADLGRVFVGVAPPPEVRSGLEHVLRDHGPLPGRAIPPINWHLTMRFIGPMELVAYERMLAELDTAELGGSFTVRLAGLGAFPNPRRATVLWVGMDRGEEQLTRLAEAVEEAVTAAGVDPEERPFRPHLTIARIRPPANVSRLVEEVDGVSIRWLVDHLTVYQSHLGAGGARYEELETIEL